MSDQTDIVERLLNWDCDPEDAAAEITRLRKMINHPSHLEGWEPSLPDLLLKIDEFTTENTRLRRQVEIAREALGKYADKDTWSSVQGCIDLRWYGIEFTVGVHGWERAKLALDAMQKEDE